MIQSLLPALRKALLFTVFLFLSTAAGFAQGPAGYTYCAPENGSFTLPAKSHVAYGADNKFKYLYNQTGTITFSNTAFGGDPLPGVFKSGFYKLADDSESVAVLEAAIRRLKKHLNGTATMSPATINLVADTIQQNIFVIGDTTSVVLAAFDLIAYYETQKGPFFLNTATKGGFPNDPGANDGFELVRAVFGVQQGIQDYIYTPEKIKKYKSILTGRKFQTANFFPGVCPAPANPQTTYTTKINAYMPTEYGKRTAFSSTPARRPTGYYLAPGSIGKVHVPANLVNKGFKILVGAHTFERTGNNPVRRFFRITNTFPITDTLTEIANPFGGGIYIITPYEANEGIADIQLTNVVPAPFFSAKSFDQTSLQNWLAVQRKNPAPWADFESDKYMMQVPTSWIYNYADPVTLMQDWDDRMDVVSKLLGYPAVRNNTILYLQIDVDIMYGFYGIGNPQINNAYNPLDVENGNKDHWFLKPGVDFWETEFHELGHAQLFSGFPGEGEAAVNLLAAAIYNRKYGVNIDTALGKSFNNIPQVTRDQAALNWIVTPNFRAGNPMDISNTTKDEVRYQQRGYAKYVEMAALFGWGVVDSFYKREQLDYIAQTPPDGLSEVDSRIYRFSKVAGIDMRPLIHFWGVQPQNAAKLKTYLDAANLGPSKRICERLYHYKSIIPLNNAQFVDHANTFFGGSVPAGGDPDYGSGWYNIWLPLYNESHGALAQQAMQNIIDLYFPDGCPLETPTPVVSVNDAGICPGQTVTLTASGATYYQWSNGATGNSIVVSPNATTTYTVIGNTAGYDAAPVTAKVTVTPVPNVSVNSANICAGETVTLTALGAENFLWSNGATSPSIDVSPNSNTTYTVTGTSNGCSAAAVNTEVTVRPTPTVSVNSANICAGETATLIASGAENFLWSNGTTGPVLDVTPDATAIYTVTGTTNGCAAVAVNSEVTVRPIPVLSVNSASICYGETATLTASGAESFHWSNGAISPAIDVTPDATAIYTVSGTTNGCVGLAVNSEVTVRPIPVISVNSASICAGETATLTASGAENFLWSNGATSPSIEVSPDANTSYAVSGTSNGCTALAVNTEVTVRPIPVLSVNSASICAGETATLTASGAENFLWSNGATSPSIEVTLDESTTYTVVGTSDGCTAAAFSTEVMVNPLPIVNLGPDTTLQAGTVLLLDANNGPDQSYVWSTGENIATISVNATGIYSVTVTNTAACTASDEIVVTIISATHQAANIVSIQLAPNPTQAQLQIICTGATMEALQLIDQLGNLVQTVKMGAADTNFYTLQLEDLPAGTYYVRIMGKDFSSSVPFVKL